MFVAASDAKISCLKHELHLIKKRDKLVSEYLAQIKKVCELLVASRHPVLDGEKNLVDS